MTSRSLRRLAAAVGVALAALGAAIPAGSQEAPASRANRHALIIGIGTYDDRAITPLRGVAHDVGNARQMAQGMGVPAANVRVLQDGAASYANIRKALQELAGSVKDGDRVFIYFSGHGTRFASNDGTDACREALVPADLSVTAKAPLLTPENIAEDLAPIYARADKVFVFFDACHSGGVQVRTMGLRDEQGDSLTPKFTALETPAYCNVPSNVRKRSVNDEAKSRGAPPNNVVQLSSSRPDEISLDSPVTGGLATTAWRYCSIYAEDLDGSGALSIAEIAACVQGRIDTRLKNERDFSGQHLVVVGNKDYSPIQEKPLQLAASNASAAAGVQGQRPGAQPAPPLPPAAGAAPPPAAAPTARMSTARFPLDSVVAQSDARHQVSTELRAQSLKIGRDSLDMQVRSSRGGYVYVILQSSDNESTYVLFPNALDRENRIRANEWMTLPRPSWRMRSQGPVGTNRVLVIVSDAPRDLSVLRAKADGPFVKTLNDRSAAQALAWVAGTAATYSEAKCASDFSRKDLNYVEECSDSFGARLLEFSEHN